MSLKNLVKQCSNATVGRSNNLPTGISEVTHDVPAFLSLEYDIAHRCSEEGMRQLLKAILEDLEGLQTIPKPLKKGYLLAFFRLAFSQDARAKGCFHPSEISTEPNPCLRKMYFQKANVPHDAGHVNFTVDNKMMRLVDLGTMAHLYIQENLDRLGVLVDFEVEVSSEEFGIEGKADGIIRFFGKDSLGKFYELEDMVLEVKTINDFGFKSLRMAKPDHLKQASIYGGILGYKRICFLYYNKNTSELKVFVHEVDNNYLDWFKDLAGNIINLYKLNTRRSRTTDVRKHELPMRMCSNRAVDRACNCAYADFCFSLKN